MLSSAHKPLVSPVKIYRPSTAATQEPAVEEVLPNSRAAMPQKLRECISEWEWAVCTFLVLISQSTQRCRSQNFASLSLEIPLQRRQGRPELSHLHHQAISTPPSPSGTTFQPFLAYSRHLVQINSTGIGFSAPGELPYSPTRAADAGPNPHLPRIRPHLPHQHLEVRPAKTVLSRPLGRGDGQRHGHWLCGFSPCCPTHQRNVILTSCRPPTNARKSTQ